MDIRFDISKGEKMWIGQIDITGNDPTFDKVVAEIPLNEGDLYSTSLNEAYRLNRLGFLVRSTSHRHRPMRKPST